MEYAIIASKKNPASLNIKERLLSVFNFHKCGKFEDEEVYCLDNLKIYTILEDLIYAEDIDRTIEADFFIFASTHRSREGVHSLSCHTPGNFGKADIGGKKGRLCAASALMLKKAYLELKSYENHVDHQITLECTHHGPYIKKPCMFIEIGSTEEHWGNKKAGEIIAKTIFKITTEELKDQKIAFGIGGPHYCNNFNKVLERTDIAIGHICPKYALEYLDEEMIKQAISKTSEKIDFVLVDWKGLGKEKTRIKELLEKLGIEYKRTDKLTP